MSSSPCSAPGRLIRDMKARKMKILVVAGAGYIGSHMVQDLLDARQPSTWARAMASRCLKRSVLPGK